MPQRLIGRLHDYQDIINRTPAVIVVWCVAPGYPVEFVSENVERLLGYKAEDFVSGKVSWPGITHPEDASRLEEELDRYRKEGILDFSQHYRLKTAWGEYRWFEDNTSALVDDKGNIVRYQAIVMDVTERKLIEERLRESERFLSNIFSSVQDSISILDRELNIIRVNPAVARQFPHDVPLVGRKCYEVYRGSKNACEACPSRNALDTGEAAFGVVGTKGPDGRVVRWNELFSFPLLDADTGEMKGVIEYVRDITEHKTLEESLKENEAKFRTLFELSNDAIFLMDGDRIIDCNKRTLEMFRCETEEVVGKTLYDLSPLTQPDGTDSKEMTVEKANCATHSGRQFYEWRFLRRDNTFFDAEVSLNLFKLKDELFLQAIVHDVTYRKAMEEELVKSKNLESIGTLAGGIAHDFNNLLTVILGNITLAQRQLRPDDKAIERLSEAERASISAKELTQQLVTFSRGGDPWKKIMAISPVVKNAARFALSGSSIKCRFSLPDDLAEVLADEVQFRQAIHNIVSNAREATPDGGVVTIGAANVTISHEDGIPLPPGNYVRISVKDKGVGIKEELLGRIFDPYFTTKDMGAQKGMGLGLSISYSIIKKHDGCISVESTAGVGTAVHIFLPARTVEDKGAESGKALPAKGRILVMDDAEAVREVTSNMLIELGYEVACAEHGREAIDLYRHALVLEVPFDLVILDLTVQGGMGGKKTLSELRTIDPSVKALVATGYTDDPIVNSYLEYGFKGAVTKPYKIEELGEVLKRLIPHM
jgi:two-component system, cell cycle sensor histidine kinase and response regulator CckA